MTPRHKPDWRDHDPGPCGCAVCILWRALQLCDSTGEELDVLGEALNMTRADVLKQTAEMINGEPDVIVGDHRKIQHRLMVKLNAKAREIGRGSGK